MYILDSFCGVVHCSGFNVTGVKPGRIKYVRYLMVEEMMGGKKIILVKIVIWKKLKEETGCLYHRVLYLEQKIYLEPYSVIT